MNALDLLTKTTEGYQLKLDKGQRFLFVGASGSGKSNAEMSFLEADPTKRIYVFDCDNRMRGAVSSIQWLGLDNFKRIDFDFYNPSDGATVMFKTLDEFLLLASKRQLPYSTICFESLGSLAQIFALESQRLRSQDKDGFKGKVRGRVQFLHPDDYNYLSTAFRLLTYNFFFPLNELGINIILSAWPTEKWGRKPGAGEYDPPEVIGERLLAPGNFVSEVDGYFDEKYYFRRKSSGIVNAPPKFTVQFNSGTAKTALSLPCNEVDITGKSFYKSWKETVESANLLGNKGN